MAQEDAVQRDKQLAQRFRQNTTRTARVRPEGLSAKAGSAIQWRDNLQQALQQSATSGQPVFWYVPTLSKTFMDRKDVIDQYMLSGPFSWPAIIQLINTHFIPVKEVPSAATARQFGLTTYKFIEPGFLILQAGEIKQSADRLTTLHPRWLFQLISRTVHASADWDSSMGSHDRSAIQLAWERFLKRQPIDQSYSVPPEDEMELKLLQGMQLFRDGKHDQAKQWWSQSAQAHPDHPLAWKAANEALGIGPFVRGFEVFQPLNELQTQAGVSSLGSAAPQGTFTVEQLWQNGTQYLLDNQRHDGGFFDSDYDFGGADSLPNVHMAVTAICGWALQRAQHRVEQDLSIRAQQAVHLAANYCQDQQNLNPKDRDELLWAEAYRLRFLSSLARETKAGSASLSEIAKRLEDLQAGNGSWFHEYPNSFVTATALIALKDAADAGASVDRQRIDLGLKRLETQRFPNGAYPYAVRRGNSGRSEPIEASAGRIPLCTLARHAWDQEDDQQLIQAVDIGLQYHSLLAKALKYDNHTDTHAFGGFFFWYDMHARSEAITAIEDDTLRGQTAKQQLEIILGLPELDGCFVDSHELGRCYGTSMALLCIDLMQRAMR